jgi:PAS domain S-box-containing protein
LSQAPAQDISRPSEDRRTFVSTHTVLVALSVCLAYYFGAKVGFALTFQPHPISTLWPPNAILLAALLLTPPRAWAWLLLAAFPAHLAVELQSGVPLAMVLCWFVSNCSEALIGAIGVRRLIEGPLRFDSFRHVSVFVVFGAFLAAFLSSFLDAAFVKLVGWGHGTYGELWRLRFFSNVLANMTLVPVIVTWATRGLTFVRSASFRDWIEPSLLTLGLLAVSIVVFSPQESGADPTPVLLYAPVPFLLWAAVRFGPVGLSTSLLVVVLLAIWGAIHGHGPFVSSSPVESALSVQLFLIVVSVPLLFLAAEIKERERSEEALRSSEERFAKAFRSSPDAMVITRQSDGRIIDVNDRWESLFGHHRAAAVGRTLWDLGMFLSAKDRELFQGVIEAHGHARNLELALRADTGEIRQTLIGAETAHMGGEPCFIAIIRDLTDQRRAEREARERQRELAHLGRVAMLGELSGALAHQLSQPLTAILSNAEAAKRLLDAERLDVRELREILGDIADEDRRAGEVIQRLRALFKKGETQLLQPVDVNETIAEALELARGDVIARNVSVATGLAIALPIVHGDRVQLQQVLLNLIHNACEAMSNVEPSGRKLTIHSELSADDTVRVRVVDTGPGLAEEVIERLFEPFFTTKSHGLGLGLSISRSIIASHGGRLWAVNNAEGGAMLCFALPGRPVHSTVQGAEDSRVQ